jgi:hypothetical protein
MVVKVLSNQNPLRGWCGAPGAFCALGYAARCGISSFLLTNQANV